jgi:DNA-binding NarL/FixJ family response regulator
LRIGPDAVPVLLVALDGGGAEQALRSDQQLTLRVVHSFLLARGELARSSFAAIVVAFRDPMPAAADELRGLREVSRAALLVTSQACTEERVTSMIKAGAGGYLLSQDMHRLPTAIRELLRGGVPMSYAISQLVLSRARRSSAKMAAVRPGAPAPDDLLTPRQRQVLEYLAKGHSYDDIALALDLSVNTVRTHVRIIYERLGASSKVEAVVAAIELRLLDRDAMP